MKNKDLKNIAKFILMVGVVLCGIAQILPWGRLEMTAPEEIPISLSINIFHFHWGGVQINPKLPGVQEWIFFPSETDFFSGIPGSPEYYGWAFATLLLYLIVPLGLVSLVVGILAYKKIERERSKNSLHAAVSSIMAVFLFIVYIQLSFLANIEEASSVLPWFWSPGLYLMILSAILFFISYIVIMRVHNEKKEEKRNMEPAKRGK